MANRYTNIIRWLTHDVGHKIKTIHPVSGDASFRRYFRIETEAGCYILMDAPPEHEPLDSYLNITTLFQQNNITVPQIFAQNLKQGFLLLSDFGDNTLLRSLTPSNADSLYKKSLQTLINIQLCPSKTHNLPAYDSEFMQRELQLFHEWFLQKQLNLQLSPSEEQLLNHSYQCIIDQVTSQAYCCVHRDYHSRNLLSLAEDHIGVIDFQDAVHGPISYDIVSLLKDCYIDWPEESVQKWLKYYWELAKATSLPAMNFDELQNDFFWAGYQRHLKAIGIFARLNILYKKPSFLRSIPRAINYLSPNHHYEQKLSNFYRFLQERILPAIRQQNIEYAS